MCPSMTEVFHGPLEGPLDPGKKWLVFQRERKPQGFRKIWKHDSNAAESFTTEHEHTLYKQFFSSKNYFVL